jgi:predicted MFS family arabinose efflux permease
MVKTDSLRGRIALMLAHCAGMLDLVALPLWVGTLMGHYRYDPQQAGGMVTLFLAGAVGASVPLASRFGRLPRRTVAVLGFGLSALAFFGVSGQNDIAVLAALHLIAGVATGAGLSVTHGSIARAINPHRMFAIAGTAVGIFAVAFFALVPPLLARLGGPVLFHVFAGVMGLAAVVSLLAFPQADSIDAPACAGPRAGGLPPLPRAVWCGIAGIAGMALVQAMTFSFLERVGRVRGFEVAAITSVLVMVSVVNMLPAPLAALLQHRLPARQVLLAGPILQGPLAAAIMLSGAFAPYAMAAALLPALIIFTHTFAFGLLARLEPSGRALAATPAMMMAGAAIGPILGGTLVKSFGYGSLAMAVAVIATFSLACFSRLPAPTAVVPRRVPA